MADRYEGPTDVNLEPDIDMIRWHLKWNFEYIHAGEIEVGYTVPETGQVTGSKRFDRADLDQAADFIYEVNSRPGANAYFRPSVFTETGEWKTDKDFQRSPGVWVDCDTADSAAGLKNSVAPLSYNAYTITGRTPHTRVQAFWRFDEPPTDAEKIKRYNDTLCKIVDGDSMVNNVSTYMRMGGTIAWPYKPGRAPELTQFHVKQDVPLSVNESEFVEKLITPYAPIIEVAERATKGLGLLETQYDLQAVLAQIAQGIERHSNVVSAAAHMVAKNYPDWMIYQTLRNECEKFWSWSDSLETEINSAIKSARAKFDPEDLAGDQINEQPAVEVTPISASAYKVVGGANVPPREWLGFDHYIRKFMSCTVAPGGVGKSSNAITEAVSMAIGKDLLNKNEPFNKPARVWYFNLEDPYLELQRRVEACLQHFGLTQDDIGDRLLVDSGRDQTLIVAKELERQVTIVEPVVDSLSAEIKRLAIDVLIIDPFVAAHTVSENSNEHINVVSNIFKAIADETSCSIELIHHTRKLSGQDATAEDARGASGLVGAARSVRAISRVAKDAVERHGIRDDHRRFFFFGDGKSNLTPPPDNNSWRRLASVPLNNASEDYPLGDEIGVVEAFTPPDPFDGIGGYQLKQVQTCMIKGDKRCRKSAQSNDWLGYLIAEVCDLETSQKPDRARISKIIKVWLENEAIVEDTVKDRSRHDVPGYIVGNYAE